MSKPIGKKKLYRHSTTFYRRLQKQLKCYSEEQNVKQFFRVVRPPQPGEKEILCTTFCCHKINGIWG